MEHYRILLVDDNVSIHEDFRKILGGHASFVTTEVQELETELFGQAPADEANDCQFDIESAYQGQEAIELVDLSFKEGRPFSLVYMDVRMPPGLDGIQTIERIWHDHPDVEMVICTAFSDYSWDDISARFGKIDNLLFVKKPFDPAAIRQMTVSLARKAERVGRSRADRAALEKEIAERTAQLADMVRSLEQIKEQSRAQVLARSAFWDGISSEMHSPLNGIMGMTDLLLDTELTQEQQDLVQGIRHCGASMQVVANDATSVVRLDRDQIDNAEIMFNVRTAVETAADACSQQSNMCTGKVLPLVAADMPLALIGDPEKVRDILFCLADSAQRWAQDAVVTIQALRAEAKNDQQVCVRFVIGVQFRADHPQSLRSEPLTVPLDLAAQAVAQLGGVVSAPSGKFSLPPYDFEIPFKNCTSATGPVLPCFGEIAGTHILVLGSNPVSRKVISLYVKHWGGSCDETGTAEDAVEMLHTHADTLRAYAMVLVDFDHAEISHYVQAAWTFRRHLNLHDVPLVCITSQARRGDAAALLSHGYWAFLTKPIKQTHLRSTVALVKNLSRQAPAQRNGVLVTKHLVDEFYDERYQVLVAGEKTGDIIDTCVLLHSMGLHCDSLIFDRQSPHPPELHRYAAAVVICVADITMLTWIKGVIGASHKEIPLLCILANPEERLIAQAQQDNALVACLPLTRDALRDILEKQVGL